MQLKWENKVRVSKKKIKTKKKKGRIKKGKRNTKAKKQRQKEEKHIDKNRRWMLYSLKVCGPEFQLLRYLKVHYRVFKCFLLGTTPSHAIYEVVYRQHIFFLQLRFNCMLPFYLVFTFPSGFPVKELHTNLFTLPVRSICPADLILFDLIPLIIDHEEYKLRASWKCSFLPILFLSSKCFMPKQALRHLQSTSPLRARSKSTHTKAHTHTHTHTHTRTKWNYNFIYRNFCFFILGSELLHSINRCNLQSYGSYWCQWDEVMNYTSVHLSSISPQSINLFAFIFLHSFSVLLWPCDIYYLSFLLHAVSISSALTIFQFAAVQYHIVSTCYCRSSWLLTWVTFCGVHLPIFPVQVHVPTSYRPTVF